jgi:hypothetical protein
MIPALFLAAGFGRLQRAANRLKRRRMELAARHAICLVDRGNGRYFSIKPHVYAASRIFGKPMGSAAALISPKPGIKQ